jgi:hypothetical protein
MSQENVEIVRRIVEDAVQGRWEESARQLGPDAEWHGTVGGLTEGSVWRGPEQIRKVFEQEDAEAWQERRLEAEEFIDAGRPRCRAPARVSAREGQRGGDGNRHRGDL